MAKKLIRLTEQDLHNIVRESVNQIIKEGCTTEGNTAYGHNRIANKFWNEYIQPCFHLADKFMQTQDMENLSTIYNALIKRYNLKAIQYDPRLAGLKEDIKGKLVEIDGFVKQFHQNNQQQG